MKKAIWIASLFSCVSAFAIILPEHPKHFEVISLSQLTEDHLKGISEGEHPEWVIELPAHSILPTTASLKGDVFRLVEEPKGQIEILQTLYARIFNEELLLSLDLIEWKPFTELTTGTSHVGLAIQDGQPAFTLGADIKRRQKD